MATLFDTLNEESADFVEEKDEAPGNNEEIQKPKSKTSDKYKKKKGKGSSKLKKKTFTSKAAPVVKKSEHENNLKNGILHRPKVDEEKASDDSAADSDDESGSNSGHSGSEDREHDCRKDNKHEKEEDEEWEKFQAKEKEEFWFVYLCDRKRHSLITAPYLVTNLVSKEEVELKFTAPEKPGIYTYSLMVRSDSYLDSDVIKTIKLDVKEAKEVDLSKLQWDVSEEEEEKDEEESAVEDSDLATDDEIDDD